MSGSITDLDLISVSQASKEITANALFDSASPSMLFSKRESTTAGLTWGYYGGTFLVSGTPTHIANGTVTLTLSSTNYVETNSAGTVSVNTTGFTFGSIPLYQITVDGAGVTAYTDLRTTATMGGDSSPIIPIGFSQKDETYSSILVIDCSTTSNFDVTLTGDITLGFDNPAYDAQKITVRIRQDSIGSRTVAFNSSVRFGADLTGFTATATANATDIIGLIYNAQDDVFDFVASVRGY